MLWLSMLNALLNILHSKTICPILVSDHLSMAYCQSIGNDIIQSWHYGLLENTTFLLQCVQRLWATQPIFCICFIYMPSVFWCQQSIDSCWSKSLLLLDITPSCLCSYSKNHPNLLLLSETDLRGGAGRPPSPLPLFFGNHLFFAILLKNYELCYLKLNWSLIIHL